MGVFYWGVMSLAGLVIGIIVAFVLSAPWAVISFPFVTLLLGCTLHPGRVKEREMDDEEFWALVGREEG